MEAALYWGRILENLVGEGGTGGRIGDGLGAGWRFSVRRRRAGGLHWWWTGWRGRAAGAVGDCRVQCRGCAGHLRWFGGNWACGGSRGGARRCRGRERGGAEAGQRARPELRRPGICVAGRACGREASGAAGGAGRGRHRDGGPGRSGGTGPEAEERPLETVEEEEIMTAAEIGISEEARKPL